MSNPHQDTRETTGISYNEQRDEYTLSSGRTFYANCGIIGLSPEFAADGVMFAEGYDGHDYTRKRYFDDPTNEWTQAERLELAEHMAALWMQWATAKAPAIEIPKWTNGDFAPNEFIAAIHDRMKADNTPNGLLITAEVAERYYPKAEWLMREDAP